MHEPLSRKLAQIIETHSNPNGITLNQMLEGTEGRGIYLVIILLALPFIVPVSLPGVSTVLGLTIAFICLRMLLGLPPRLPRLFGDRALSPPAQRRILNGSMKFLRFVEKLAKPRRTPWMTFRVARLWNAGLMMGMACLLALPFPPFPPFTNSLPCYSLVLLAVSMMEEDGVLIWYSYAVVLGTIIYLVAIAAVLEPVVTRIYHWLAHLFQS
jgi:hypothetical protein